VVKVITRTGLLLYGYGDINIGTNPSDKKEYLFLRRLIIKLSKESGYSPGELDKIFGTLERVSVTLVQVAISAL